jgi:hypothetical protein
VSEDIRKTVFEEEAGLTMIEDNIIRLVTLLGISLFTLLKCDRNFALGLASGNVITKIRFF